jgi:hypothetical protein
MIHHPADFFLTAEAVEQGWVAFYLRVRNFDGNRPPVVEIGGAENRRHTAAGSESVNAVVIELIANMENGHRERICVKGAVQAANPKSSKGAAITSKAS